MKDTIIWEIFFTDNKGDDDTDDLAFFKGTLDEAVRYAKALILAHVRSEEDPGDIEYVSFNDLCYDGEVGTIQRKNSHRTFWVKRHLRHSIVTIEDIDSEGEKLLEKFPNGIDEENKEDFLQIV